MAIWFYNSQFGCEDEYVETKRPDNYLHSNLVWTGRSRPVGPVVIPIPPRINWAELGHKVLQVEPLPEKKD